MEKMDLNEIRILANSILFNNENFKLNELRLAPDDGAMDALKNMRHSMYDTQVPQGVNDSTSVFEKQQNPLPVSPTDVIPTQISVNVSQNKNFIPNNKVQLKNSIAALIKDEDLELNVDEIEKIYKVLKKYFKKLKESN